MDDRWNLPEWATEIRPHQLTAIDAVLEEFNGGKDVVVLDAPTGTGKTLIGELIRQETAGQALYVCSDKGLQDQFLMDFPDSRVLKGRANYVPERRIQTGGEWTTCDDCTGVNCPYCPDRAECPYLVARREALAAETAVLNSAYYLAELNGPGRFGGRGLAVVDEADTLEPALMRWVEVRLTAGRARKLGLWIPKKGTHQTTIAKWVSGQVIPAMIDAKATEHDPKKKRGLDRQVQAWRRFLGSWNRGDVWVRDNFGDGLVMKPVEVGPQARSAVWPHAKRFLLMSATVISAEMMLDGLGWEGEYGEVTVPMTFPVENRRIIVAPVADMSRKGKEAGEWGKMAPAIRGVLREHPGERVLVHAVSYELTKMLAAELEGCGRKVLHYTRAEDKDDTVQAYRDTEGAMLVAPSLDRGVDFAGDLCRVVVVAKVPFPYLGDPQVSARKNSTERGNVWYAVETIRSLVQMTGRGVRSADDHAVSYILDKSFVQVMKRSEHYFPKWWAEALVTNYNPQQLLGGDR